MLLSENTMIKRNLFAELTEGFEALAGSRASEVSLRQYTVEIAAQPDVAVAELSTLRTLPIPSYSTVAPERE